MMRFRIVASVILLWTGATKLMTHRGTRRSQSLKKLCPALWPLYVLLMGLSLYFLAVATVGFRGQTPALAFRVVHLASWAVVVGASAILLGRAAPRSPDVLIGAPLLLTALLKNGTILGCMSWLVWSTWGPRPGSSKGT